MASRLLDKGLTFGRFVPRGLLWGLCPPASRCCCDRYARPHHTRPNNQPRTGGAQAACTGAFAGLSAAPAPELAPLVRRPPRRLCRPQPLALPRLWAPAPCCILRKSAAPPAPSSRRRVSSCYARRQRGCPSSFRPPARAHAAAGSTNGRWRAVLKGGARAHHAQRPARLQLRLAIHARLGCREAIRSTRTPPSRGNSRPNAANSRARAISASTGLQRRLQRGLSLPLHELRRRGSIAVKGESLPLRRRGRE